MAVQEVFGRYRLLIEAIAAQTERSDEWANDLRHAIRLFEQEIGQLEQSHASQLKSRLRNWFEEEASGCHSKRRRQVFSAITHLLERDTR